MRKNEAIPIDYELTKIVYDDLKYLSRDWGPNVEDDYLRRGSTVLRRFLIDGDLNKVAYMFGIEIKIFCNPYSEDKILKRPKYYAAGGAQSRGCAVNDLTYDDSLAGRTNGNSCDPDLVHNCKILINSNELSGHVSLKIRELKSVPALVPINLSAYSSQPSFIIENTKITHGEIINYVANKKGDAHYDKNRKDEALEKKYKLLDNLQNVIANRDAVYYALLSIGRTIVESEDVKKLIGLIDACFQS